MRQISKITAQDLAGKLVKELATRPNDSSAYGGSRLSPQQVKERFDALGLLLVDKINEIINDWNNGGISTEEIEDIIIKYLEENPVKTGATPEQVEQIENNTSEIEAHAKAIEQHQDAISDLGNALITLEDQTIMPIRDDIEQHTNDIAENKAATQKNAEDISSMKQDIAEIESSPGVYPVLGMYDSDPLTWGDPLANNRREPWYAIVVNRTVSKYKLWTYSQTANAWEYVKDVAAGDLMLMLEDSNEGAIKKHRKYDVWQFMKAYDSNGNLQGLTVRTILNFPYDIVEQNAADIAALREDIPTDEHINGLINSALGVIENGAY